MEVAPDFWAVARLGQSQNSKPHPRELCTLGSHICTSVIASDILGYWQDSCPAEASPIPSTVLSLGTYMSYQGATEQHSGCFSGQMP